MYNIHIDKNISIVSIQEAQCNFSLLPPRPHHPYLPHPLHFQPFPYAFLFPNVSSNCISYLFTHNFRTLLPSDYVLDMHSFLPYVFPPRVLKSFSLKTCSGNAISGPLRAGSAPAKRWKRDTRSCLNRLVSGWCNGCFILLIFWNLMFVSMASQPTPPRNKGLIRPY